MIIPSQTLINCNTKKFHIWDSRYAVFINENIQIFVIAVAVSIFKNHIITFVDIERQFIYLKPICNVYKIRINMVNQLI